MKRLFSGGRVGKMFWRHGALVIVMLLIAVPFLKSSTVAAQLGSRSITIGTSQPSAVTTHSFTFDTTTSGNIGSIEFQYCTSSPLIGTPCTAPAGLSVAAAALNSQAGQTGFSIDAATNANDLIISRAPALASPGTVNYSFGNITNPSTVNESVYVRILTYAATGATGSSTDHGAVVFDISLGLGTTAYVPPRLVLCVGAVVALDCSSQLHNIQDMGVLTTKTTGFTTTQFSVGTNDPGGYNIYVYGPTLTSGNNVIQPTAGLLPSIKGISEFGLNLIANGSPPVGADPIGAGTGVILNGYNQPNQFKFQSGDLIASSVFSTDFNLFTVSYIANIDKTQQPGIYTTTMTYVGIAAF